MYYRLKASVLSAGYRFVRSKTAGRIQASQEKGNQPIDFEAVVEEGHRKIKQLKPWLVDFPIPKGIEAHLYDLEFPSPVTIAAFESDPEILEIYLRVGAGGVCVKTAMRDIREGNARPRLQRVFDESGEGLINAMGLPGPGIEGLVEKVRGSRLFSFGRPVGLSVGGSSQEEYIEVFNALNDFMKSVSVPHYFEVNISCPNTPEGQQMSRYPDLLWHLIDYMRERTDAVVGVKLSPDMSDSALVIFGELMRSFKRTYINCGNTSFRKCEDVALPSDSISIGGGGLSGPSLYKRTLHMAKLLSPRLPVIATGGVDSARKVRELRKAGASLVGIATAVGKDLYCVPKINYSL